MRRSWATVAVVVALAVVLGASIAASSVAPPIPAAVDPGETTVPMSTPVDGQSCDTALDITREGENQSVPICVDRPLDVEDPTVRELLVVIHGDSRNGSDYFDYAVAAAEAADARDVLIVAPQFLTNGDRRDQDLDRSTMTWSADGWKEGAASTGGSRPWRLSSFEVIDELIHQTIDGGAYPNLREVVVAGHSAGGQFVNRYAAGTSVLDDRPSVALRFVVANPSSYLYLDDRRWSPDESGFTAPSDHDQRRCSGYDRYKYGLEDRNDYMNAKTAGQIISTYGRRQVTYALGELDTDPNGTNMDTSCASQFQGANRLERGLTYHAFLQMFYGPGIAAGHQLLVIPGVGHDGAAMLASPLLRPALFGT